jgi:hypothetical protein
MIPAGTEHCFEAVVVQKLNNSIMKNGLINRVLWKSHVSKQQTHKQLKHAA